MTNQANFTSSTTNFDVPSLHLLINEIEVALKDAETHLSEFHDDEEQAPLLMDSATVIDQLASIFDLIHFKGTSELAHAISGNLKKLHDSADNSDSELIMDISEGIMVLDRYIEFVLLKEMVEPSLILPIINKLRHHLGELALSGDEVYKSNNVSILNPERHYETLSQLDIDKNQIISAYRAGLAVALDKDNNQLSADENQKLHALSAATQNIANASKTLFWQSAATATKNLNEILPLTNAKKRVLIYLEQQLQNYLPIQDRRFADLVSLACSRDDSFLKTAQSQYGLNQLSDSEQHELRRFLFGPNREISDTLNLLIQGEISAIKEKVDSLARQENTINSVTNTDIAKQIHELGSAMQLLGLDDASTALKSAASEVANWQTPTPEDFDRLLSELMVAENASIFLSKTHTPGAVKLSLHNRNISLHQLDTAYETLLKESRANIATITQAISDYMTDANHDIMHLQTTPEALEQAAGAADFLKIPNTAKMLSRLASYINNQAIEARVVLSEDKLADIADVIMAADYHFEALEENRPISKQSMHIGQHSLNRLLTTQ